MQFLYTHHVMRVGLCIFVVVLLMSGCAHTKLLKQGDSFAQQGRYELAMHQYDQALQIKPGREETRDKFTHAKSDYRDWLTTINRAADTAYARNQKGRALLLYGKVLSGDLNPTSNHQAESRFRALHSQLSDQSLLHVKLYYSTPVFGHDLELGIADILPIQHNYTGLPNEREFAFELEEIDGVITEWEEELTGEYVSSIRLVPNPEIAYLQRQIHHSNHEIKELRHDRRKHKHQIEDAQNLVAHLKEEEDHDDDEHHEAEHETKQESEELKQAKSQLRRARREFRETTQEMEDHEDQLHHTVHQLDMTPATILEDVYSTHSYFVVHSSYEMRGEVIVTEGNQSTAYELQVVSQDSYHEAQPLLDLKADPLNQMSEQQLRGELQASARTFAQDYIRTEVRSHRASLLTSANRTVGSDSRVEKLVSYGLSGRNGVSSHISGKMQQQLQSEYGVEGEFPINTLLRGF